MEKKKLKLSISGSSKKTFSSIEQAKSKSKNTVVIEKKTSKFAGKGQFSRQNNNNFRTNIEYVTIASSGTASDFGDATFPVAYRGVTSDSHGGLGGF